MGGLEGRVGGGPAGGRPGSGGGARFFGAAGNSLLGVDGFDAELLVLSFDDCLGGADGLELGTGGGLIGGATVAAPGVGSSGTSGTSLGLSTCGMVCSTPFTQALPDSATGS